MPNFNRTKFFDGYRVFLDRLGFDLTQSRVDALNFLLDMFERMPVWNDERHCAYALATIHIETAFTYLPIQEFGSQAYFERRYGSQTRKGRELGNDAPGEGAKYSGKGFVQLTGESNYEKLEIKIRQKFPQIVNDWERKTSKRFDLTDFAEQAKDQTFAFLIMTLGMFEGLFTGKKFSDFITLQFCDYKNARKIINGLDRADEIAQYARQIEKILLNSKVSTAVPQSSANVVLPRIPLSAENSESEQPPINLGEVDSNGNADQFVSSENTAQDNPPAPEPIPVPQVSAETEEKKEVSGIQASLAGAVTFITTSCMGILTWLGGVAWQIVAVLVGAAIVVGIIYFINRFWFANREKQREHDERMRREQQAFELQKLTLESAMRKDLNTVVIKPTPMKNSDSDGGK